MRYLTKEWYRRSKQTDLHESFEIIGDDVVGDPLLFERLFEQGAAEYVQLQSELQLRKPGESMLLSLLLSDPETAGAAVDLADLVPGVGGAAEASEAADDQQSFDPEQARAAFFAEYEQRLAGLDALYPGEILDQIQDRRLFVLGYCTQAVFDSLRRFSESNQADVDRVLAEAQATHENAGVPERIAGQFGSNGALVTGVQQDAGVGADADAGADLVLAVDDASVFSDVRAYRFRDARIVTQDASPVGARWLYDEIYAVDGMYEVHVLFCRDEDELIELVLQCTDIEFTV